MALQFGNTWWGKKWVDSIENTEYKNRLPRGKRYARNGSVSHIEIENNQVYAHVQGSRRTPYKVHVAMKSFSKKQKQIILDIIVNNTLYLSELLIRKLPEKLYDECKSASINFFPSRWQDFNANCSCPDWAPCCKHIAAVIYLIANEIDRNPFLAFSLHEMDIFSELQKYGHFANKSHKTKILSPSDLWGKKVEKSQDWQFDKDIFDQIDFSIIPISGEKLLGLLSNNPLFQTKKNFKQTLSHAYKKIAKETKYFAFKVDNTEKKENTELFIKNIFKVDKKLNLKVFSLESSEEKIDLNDKKTMIDIIELCQSVPAKSIAFHEANLRSLILLVQFTLKILESGAFLPELLEIEKEKKYRIRWIPAFIIPEVKKIFDQIVQITPSKFLTTSLKREETLTKKEQIKIMFSFLVESLIKFYLKGNDLYKNDLISEIFFRKKELNSTSFEMKEVPESIALWLSRFSISHKIYVPLVKVEESKNGFLLDLYAENRKKQFQEPIPFKKVLKDKKFSNIRLEIMKDITLLAEQFPDIKIFVESEGMKKLKYNHKNFVEVFFQYLPILQLLGISVLFPKSLQKLIRPQISIVVKKKGSSKNTKSYLSINDMMEFSWQIALGKDKISAEEFCKLVKSQSGIVKIKDRFVYLDEKEIQKILKNIEKEPKLSTQEKLQTVLSNEYKGVEITLNDELRKLIKSFLKIKKITSPKELNADLRSYQQRGFEWLYKNTQIGFGSLIADDMGLGKTIQVITLLLAMKNKKKLKKNPALVIVPTTLLTNWNKEIKKFAPNLRVHTFYGVQRKLETKNIDILLTTYGLVRRDINKFQKTSWTSIILDEAQNIKNTFTEQTKCIKKLNSDTRIAMTGTPIENRLTEYWSIFDFLNKGYLKGINSFKKEFAIPIEQNRDRKALERFKKITSPFILRRLKTDKSIITDLPDKMESDQYCELTKDQAALYQNIMDQTMKAIESTEAGIAKRGLVLKLITNLKQICNHPAHFLKKKEASPNLSGKTSMLMELLETIYENEEKVLIFTQYTEMGKLLQEMIHKRFSKEPIFVHGGVTRKKRDEMVDQFQTQPYTKTMLLSLKAGGTGLNLTAAQNVIHFDLWWNPAVEAQATDRAYRIGQKKNVMVYRLITKSTFEEKIDQMIKDKKELADLAISKGEKWIGECSNKELREMFSLSSTNAQS